MKKFIGAIPAFWRRAIFYAAMIVIGFVVTSILITLYVVADAMYGATYARIICVMAIIGTAVVAAMEA